MNRKPVVRTLSVGGLFLCGLALALLAPPGAAQSQQAQRAPHAARAPQVLPQAPPATEVPLAPPALPAPPPQIVLPDLMAVELPAGVTELTPTDQPLRDFLTAATSGQRHVTTDLSRNLGAGAARVTWSAWDGEPGIGTPAVNRAATVFVLPNGMIQVGASGDENATAGNNAAHITRDENGHVHMVWVGSGRAGGATGPIYRRGFVGDDGSAALETPPTPLAAGTPADWNAYPGLAANGNTVDVVWQGGGKAWTRRLSLDQSGYVWGPPHDTGAKSEGRDTGPSIATDAKGVHIVTSSGVYAFSNDGGVSWRTEPIPIPLGQRPKTASLALDSAGIVTIAFSSLISDPKDVSKNEGSGGYWQLRIVQRTPDGQWSAASDALAEFPVWGEPLPRQDILADWARVAVDRARGIHLVWHGTAASHIYGHDQAYYTWRPAGADWCQPVPLFPPDAAHGIKFSFAPSLTLDGERALATVFYDVFKGEQWAGFDAVLVPLRDGAPNGSPLPISQFVRASIDRKTPEFSLSTRFPAAAPAVIHGRDGRTWVDVLETLIPMGVPDSPKLIVWHRLDVSGQVSKR
jgi:hypothetical protein